MKTLNKYLFGTQRGTYYLLGAESGIGKSTLTDYMFFYNLYSATKQAGIKLELDYFSFEMQEEKQKSKLTAHLYYAKYGEYLCMGDLLSWKWPGDIMTEEQQTRVATLKPVVDEVFSQVTFFSSANPIEMWERLKDRAAKSGEVIYQKDNDGRAINVIGYKPFEGHENIFRMTIVDHLAQVELLPRMTLKETMDTASSFFVKARNNLGDSFLVVQQFNSEMQGAAREYQKNSVAYAPVRLDFGDSKYPYRDADVVIGLTRPSKLQLDSYASFTELKRWGHHFTLAYIMKNRFGYEGTAVPLFIDQIAGIPEELSSTNWNPLVQQQQYIAKAEMLKNLCQ